MIKIVTVVGARPQFIKAATVARAIRTRYFQSVSEVLVHTGQHFDDNMSKVFFDELDIPKPQFNLGISGGSHGQMTGRMIESIERVLCIEKPDWLLVYGDTNSTLSAALAATKLHIPIAHVEAGIRSNNLRMPEEINRIVVDRISSLLLCPTSEAVENLKGEGLGERAHDIGDVMYDICLYLAEASRRVDIGTFGIFPREYLLVTCHRPENTDDRDRLKSILEALSSIARARPVVFSMHPRTRTRIKHFGLEDVTRTLKVIDPVSYLTMAALLQNAFAIVTDSGGLQKEAFFYRVPCITIRPDTEWPQIVSSGWNVLIDCDGERLEYEVEKCYSRDPLPYEPASIFGRGDAAFRAIDLMVGRLIR